MSQQPRPTLDYDHESYGTRWYDSPDVADIFHPLPDTNLVVVNRAALADYLACEGWPVEDTDALVGPLHIDAQQLDAWEESRARDYDVTDDVPFD